MNDSSFQELPQENRRPTIITVFAILTLVYTGFSLISYAFGGLLSSNSQFTPEGFETPLWETLVSAVLVLGKGGAAFMILKMRKIGVYLYTVTEVALTLLGLLGLDRSLQLMRERPEFDEMPFDMGMITIVTFAFMAVLSILWIAVYFSQINKMK